jgi:hypothetical protein
LERYFQELDVTFRKGFAYEMPAWTAIGVTELIARAQ